jgi:hypothetical protein
MVECSIPTLPSSGLTSASPLNPRGRVTGWGRLFLSPSPGSILPSLSPDQEANDNRREPGTTHQAETLETRSEVSWPANLDPHDLGRIVVTDAAGNNVLTGKLR